MVLRWGDAGSDEPAKVDRGEAVFHAFSTDSCIEDGTVLMWPAAVIEWPSGEVTSVHIEFIRFLGPLAESR